MLAGAAALAMLSSCALTWVVRELARKCGWMFGPASLRHIHKSPIPRLGGVAVFLAIVLALAVSTTIRQFSTVGLFFHLLLPAAFLLLIGVADDLSGLAPKRKLLAQIIAALCLFISGVRFPAPGFLESTEWLAIFVSLFLTVFWGVTVMNAVNLIDGLDGLASGSSFFIVAGLVLLALIAGNFEIALIGTVTAGAVAGFLWFNRTPASIFLGDSGSLVLGCLIAGLSIRIIDELPAGWIACPIVLAHPFAEVAVSVARRAVRADNIFCADRRHLHHRLLDRGLSHGDASRVLVVVSFLFTVLGVLAGFGQGWAVVAAMSSAVLAVAFISQMRYGEFIHLGRWLRKAPRQRSVIAANLRLEDLSDSVSKARSMTELRILLSEGFGSMGFESARLNVRSYDLGSRIAPCPAGSLGLSFPLYAEGLRMGTLDLRWKITAGNWPFDPDFFASQFLPSLSSKIRDFGCIYRELVETSPAPLIQPEMLSGFVMENPPSRLPLEN